MLILYFINIFIILLILCLLLYFNTQLKIPKDPIHLAYF